MQKDISHQNIVIKIRGKRSAGTKILEPEIVRSENQLVRIRFGMTCQNVVLRSSAYAWISTFAV